MNNNKIIKLDVGCGRNKKNTFTGVDLFPEPGVDFVVDLNKEKLPFKDSSVSEIHCSHFLEHINDVELVLKEFTRVLKVGKKITIIVPHYSNPYAYHFTHKTYWSSYSLKQEYIDYYLRLPLRIDDVEIRFSNGYLFNGLFGFLANKFRNIYERLLSSIIKAWEIEFTLIKTAEK